MVIAYAQTVSTDIILSEIQALLDWQTDVLRQCLFPAAQLRPVDPRAPSALLEWCRREQEKNLLDSKFVDRLATIHATLSKAAEEAIDYCKGGQALSIVLFDALEHQCEGYASHIRRLQQAMSDSAVAVDAVTGLRTIAGMRNDIKREQDRFDRKGTSFSIAAGEIDHLDDLMQRYDRRTLEGIYAHVAQIIMGMTRSFDDAYFLGRGEYMIVLKHLEFRDAGAVMERLRVQVAETPYVTPAGERLKLTISFGLTEAMQRDTPDLGIEHARSALFDAKQLGNTVAEYKELSALQRYAQDMKQQ